MRLKMLACKVMFREISLLAAKSSNYIDTTFLRQGLHDTPSTLRETLLNEIGRIDSGDDLYSCKTYIDEDFDAILLGYGLCSNGIVGLSSKKYKLVIPRAHDCITLFLGSKEKYRNYFDSHKGVYWYNAGWIENTPMPGKKRYDWYRSIYAQNYGEENADYLMDMEQGWLKEYEWCCFVDWPDFDNSGHKQFTKESAAFLGWNYDELAGDNRLLQDFLDGNWDEERFLVVPPGKSVEPSYDEGIIRF